MQSLALPMPARPAALSHLPQVGLADCAVHELRAPEATATHLLFAVLLLARLPIGTPILWVGRGSSAYPPGLAWAGLNPARCLFATATTNDEILAALEVALRGGMAGLAEAGPLTRLAAKRLALAARQGGGIGFLLRHAPAQTPQDSTACATRWLITPLPDEKIRAELLYAKGGRPGVFIYQCQEAANGTKTLHLALVPEHAAQSQQERRTA